MEDVGISDEQKIIKKLYPNLKGIDFGDVFTTAKGDSPEKFFMKPKSQNIIKDLDNGYTIREIMEMRKCSPNLVSKVKKLSIQNRTSLKRNN